VERTPQTVVFAATKTQVRATVRAVPTDQAELALLVAKQDQLFPQQRHRHYRPLGREFIAERSGLPVAAQHLAGRGARTHTGQLVVEFLTDHAVCPLAGGVRAR